MTVDLNQTDADLCRQEGQRWFPNMVWVKQCEGTVAYSCQDRWEQGLPGQFKTALQCTDLQGWDPW